ncbi:MAG: phasin family protein [Bauldia sp.]|uniref:phasin family protein n=1 Tax=Bauldia sp. TaxID=2575872 RepID=UPI001D82C8A0|nr:phasin family protein [Bauldia sp.]MCB1495487.1 phasin family protein [Bauldia sp.]
MQRTPFDIPDQIREITDKSVAEAKKALEQYLDATQQAIAKAESSTRTVQEGAAEVNRQAFAFVEENVSASFELAQRLVQARTAEEIAALQKEYFTKQMKAFADQGKSIGAMVERAGAEAAKKAQR